MAENWGVGNKADSKAFATARVGNEEVELIHGENPHSRRDGSVYARFKGGSIEGFDGHQTCIKVEVEESNYLKTSGLSGNEVRRACVARIFFGDRQIYEVGGRDIMPTLLAAHNAVAKLQDLSPYMFGDVDAELIGRKVWYRDDPAVITRFIGDQGAVILKADGCRFRPPAWQRDDPEEMAMAEMDGEDQEIKDDILSPHIWWFRD